jgi:3-methyladenine DNA glycosylase AlkD
MMTAEKTPFLSLITEIREAMEQAAGRTEPLADRKFHRHGEYGALGLKAAQYYRIMDVFLPRFNTLSLPEILKSAQALLDTGIGELGHAGLHVLSLRTKELTPDHFPLFDRMADEFHSWSHVDGFCIEILQPLLETHPEETLGLLERWGGSPNRFKRRASVVTFVRKAGKSGRYTEPMLRLCEKLVWDEEDIVQKGVGWALKDNLRSARDKVLPYIKELRRRGVPSTITLYAIRDLKGEERQAVLAIKREAKRKLPAS